MTPKNKQSDNKGSFWTPMRLSLTVVTLLLLALLGFSSCNSGDEKREDVASQPAKNAPAQPIKPAPPRPAAAAPSVLPPTVREARLKTVSGETITLGDYSGKVVLLNLWATWCGPCRVETPELVRLHKEYRSKGVEMLGLSTENPDTSAGLVKEFVQTFKVDYRIGWAPPEVTYSLYQVAPQRDAIPQSFIISRDGRILQKFVGFSQTYTPPQIRQALDDALNFKG